MFPGVHCLREFQQNGVFDEVCGHADGLGCQGPQRSAQQISSCLASGYKCSIQWLLFVFFRKGENVLNI